MKDNDLLLLLGGAAVAGYIMLKPTQEPNAYEQASEAINNTVNSIENAASNAINQAQSQMNDLYLELLNPGTNYEGGVLVSGGQGGVVTSPLQGLIASLHSMGVDTTALESLYFGMNGAPGLPFTSNITATLPSVVGAPSPTGNEGQAPQYRIIDYGDINNRLDIRADSPYVTWFPGSSSWAAGWINADTWYYNPLGSYLGAGATPAAQPLSPTQFMHG